MTCFDVVGVDVDDRDVEALREIGGVARRARILGIGREADLVVRDDVNRAAGRIAREPCRLSTSATTPCARERRVAVHRGSARHARLRASLRGVLWSVCSARVRPSTTPSTASRWLGLEASSTSISRFRRGCGTFPRRRDGTSRRRSRSVLVALAARDRRIEFDEQRLVRTVDDVRDRRQAAAMRHADALRFERRRSANSVIISSSIGTIESSPSIEKVF
jgi:hypothetical protein